MWYLKTKEQTMIITSQGLALSSVLENKRQKKVVLRQKKNKEKKRQLIDKSSFNAKLELLIEEKKKTKDINLFLRIIKASNLIQQ